MKINEVEKLLEIPKATIRYYEEEGLIKPARTETGYREYNEDDIRTLKMVIVLRKIGVAIPDIRSLLDDKVNLNDVLNSTMSDLEKQKSELSAAMRMCGELLANNETIGTFDAEKHFEEIREMEKSGGKFVSLAKEFAAYQANDMRRLGWLPQNPYAPVYKKLIKTLSMAFVVFGGALAGRLLITGETVESGLEYLGVYCISYIVVTALASGLCFTALKVGGEKAEKQFRNGYSIVAIVFIAFVVILLVAIRRGII